MNVEYKVVQPKNIISLEQRFAIDVLTGLSHSPKAIPSKYLYDAEGDRLFQRIMELPEYYPTRCEFEILRKQKNAILELIRERPFNLVELGVGDGQKTMVLLEHFVKNVPHLRYVPIDISEAAIKGLLERLPRDFPQLEIQGLVADYFDGLEWLSHLDRQHNMVLFLGSNIGNFTHSEARVFLYSMWNALNDGDYVLIGFDLKKDIRMLVRAYNDSQGVTAQFNLNLLYRINRELGGNFEPEQFQYHSTYNVLSGAIESYLVSRRRQSVVIEKLNQSFSFQPWEPVHIEYSHKFLEPDIRVLAGETGFHVVRQFYDAKRYFVDSLWKVVKE